MTKSAKNISHLQEIISANVRKRRLHLGLSQEEFADLCGYHRTYIGSIERSERNITVMTLEALAKHLGAKPADLLSENG